MDVNGVGAVRFADAVCGTCLVDHDGNWTVKYVSDMASLERGCIRLLAMCVSCRVGNGVESSEVVMGSDY